MQNVDLVNESHKALQELSRARADFNSGKTTTERARQSIGFFNATSRAIGTAINAEKWNVNKIKNSKSK